MGSRPAHGGDQVIAYAVATNNTTIVYTVPAGKTLYLKGFNIGCLGGGAVTSHYLLIRNAADAVWKYLQYLPTAAAGCIGFTRDYSQPLEVPSGYDVCVYNNNGTAYTGACIDGWIEDNP